MKKGNVNDKCVVPDVEVVTPDLVVFPVAVSGMISPVSEDIAPVNELPVVLRIQSR
jgi:hypothetical protein